MNSLQIWTLIKCPSDHPINSTKALNSITFLESDSQHTEGTFCYARSLA